MFAALGVAVCLLSGCAGNGGNAPISSGPSIATPAGRPSGGSPATGAASERPPVIVNGQAIPWDALRPAMVEAAGAVALEEAALDIALRDALGARGVRMADLDLGAERAILLEQLASAAPVRTTRATESQADRAERLLDELRAARGLGTARFEGFLRRNAALRLLVRDDVVLNESVIRQAYELRHGERIPARIIVVDSISDAIRATERLDAGEPFAEVAALVSTDESASRGGRLEPVSPVDPTYPSAIREALANLRPGERSAPIAIETGVAILLRETAPAPTDAAPSIESVREDLERDARLRQERILMGEKARELLNRSRITVFDDALDDAWRRRTGARR